MSNQRVLVVVTDPVPPSALQRAVRDHVDPGADVRLVSSPSLSFLEWVSSDEDERVPRRRSSLPKADAHSTSRDQSTWNSATPTQCRQSRRCTAERSPADEILLVSPTGGSITRARTGPPFRRPGALRIDPGFLGARAGDRPAETTCHRIRLPTMHDPKPLEAQTRSWGSGESSWPSQRDRVGARFKDWERVYQTTEQTDHPRPVPASRARPV